MLKLYNSPELKIKEFHGTDIVRTSSDDGFVSNGNFNGNDQDQQWGWGE